MGILKVGKRVPEFAVKDGEDNTVRLGNYAGQKVVLYFYPKDHTPGCTTEACEFNALHAKFRKSGAVVLGVSPDSSKSHHTFSELFGLEFRLLADVDHELAESLGVWQKKTLYGTTRMGISRTTYLIDEKGRVERVWENVKVPGHARSVLAAVRGEPEPKPLKRKKTAKKKTAKKKTAKKKATKKKATKKKTAKKKTAKKKTAKKKATKKKAAKKKTAKKKATKKKAAKKKTAKKKATKKKATKKKKAAKKKATKKKAAKKKAAKKKTAKKKATKKKAAKKKAKRRR